MPAVSKCLITLNILIRKNTKDNYNDENWKYLSEIALFKEKFKWCFEKPTKESCFNQIVEFIKWYNNEKNN